jgi:hypothetical protein
LKKRSLSALLASGLLLATASLALTGCGNRVYYYPEYNYAGRPIPPSGLLQRVLASYTINGSSGGLEILDGLRDLRGNVQNTIHSFAIAGYSSAQPVQIINFPEEETGYVLSYTDGSLASISYAQESNNGSYASFGADPASAAASPNGKIFAGAAEQSGLLVVSYYGTSYSLSLPNVDKVVVDQGSSVVLAMVRNSSELYRVVKLPATPNPVLPPGYVDCEPLLLPVVCVVPVADTNSAGVQQAAYDHPVNVSFSLDGSTAYVLNSGPENSGTTAGVTFLQMSALNILNVPTYDPLCGDTGHPACPAGATSPLSSIGVPNPVPVPGGATVALSDSNYLYIAGQQLQASGPYAGLFAGNLTLLNLSNYTTGTPISISDGNHTKMVFADDGPGVDGSTLWIGSSQCASGVRQAKATAGVLTQDANTNCLTRYVLGSNPVLPTWTAGTAYAIGARVTDGTNIEIAQNGGTSGATKPAWAGAVDGTVTDGNIVWVNLGAMTQAQIIPGVTPNNSALMPVSYPNTEENALYYGSLTGLCWVENYGKVYTADGGQIHAFNTIDGSERNNYNITVQGTVFDVAYMDALTNADN